MATQYLEILALQRPVYYGTDNLGRVMFSVNFSVVAKSPIALLQLEFAKVLVDAGLATTGVDLFTNPKFEVPTGVGPYILVLATGGPTPIDFHDGAQLERATVQVTVRGDNSITTETRVLAIWRALHGIRSQTLAA